MNSMAHAFAAAQTGSQRKQSEPAKPQKPAPVHLVVKPRLEESSQSEPWKYLEIQKISCVRVKVPVLGTAAYGSRLDFIPAHSFESADGDIEVADHYRIGQSVGNGVFVNRHFYVPEAKLGRTVTCEVTVMMKTRGGRRHVYLDYHFQEDVKATHELKFTDEGDIEIPGSRTRLRIVELTK